MKAKITEIVLAVFEANNDNVNISKMINVTLNFDTIEETIAFFKRIDLPGAAAEKPAKGKKQSAAATTPVVETTGGTGATDTVDFDLGGGDDLDNLLGGGAAKVYTVDDLRDKASEVAGKSESHKKQVVALIQAYKVGAISEIKPEHFPVFMDKINAIK